MLRVDKLSKTYGRTRALDSVGFAADAGRVTAVVGPNGAGKTTLFSILAGIIEPDSGECSLDGLSRRGWRRGEVGYVAADPFFYDRLTGYQTLSFERTMRRIDLSDDRVREQLIEWDAREFSGQPMGSLSLGMRKRILLACAFLGDPKLVILDEPLNGLDIQGVLLLKDRLTQARRVGSHVLMCSHLLDFVQDHADKTIFLSGGRVVKELDSTDGSLESAYRREFMEPQAGSET